MIDVTFEVEDDGQVYAYYDLCLHPEEFVNGVAQETMSSLAPEIEADFQREPGPVITPIHFTTPRQRRYIMAKKVDGDLPGTYPRSHALAQAWKLQVVYVPGEITFIYMHNPRDEAVWVEGLHQQPWLKTTGWIYIPDLEEKWIPIIDRQLESDLAKAFKAIK